MLHRKDADRLRTNEIAPGYVRPAYEGQSFANVPATIGSLLGVDLGGTPLSISMESFDDTRVETVVVVLVDGFGFEQWERHYAEHEFLARLTDRAPVTPLTSVYPSETAAAMSTYMTGRTPVEHGLIGWNICIKDVVIESLPFRTKQDEDAGEALGIDDALRDGVPIAEQFSEEGIETRHVVPESIVRDDADDLPFGRATYDDLDAFTSQLREAIQSTESGFIHAYLPHVDTAAHEVGTTAPDYCAVVETVTAAIEHSLVGLDDETAARTLLVVTADHGHVDTTPEQNLDLLQLDVVASAVGTDARGTPLFGGGPRNVHLYMEEPERVRDELADELVGERDALVLLREDALSEGLFGPGNPSKTFYRQCGDVLIIPRNRSMWHGKERAELELVGMHGGLHPNEQLVPFAAIRLDELYG